VAIDTLVFAKLRLMATGLEGDTIHFFPAPSRERWVYEGVPIPSELARFFSTVYRLTMPYDSMFVVGSVALDSARVGYVLRVPGYYAPSRLDLWIHSPGSRGLTGPITLADMWADAGDLGCTMGWLVDLDRDGTRDIVIVDVASYSDLDYEEGADTSSGARVELAVLSQSLREPLLRVRERLSGPDSSFWVAERWGHCN
jgi:hypothetical protein